MRNKSLIVLALITISIPLTIFLVNRVQTYINRAATPAGTTVGIIRWDAWTPNQLTQDPTKPNPVGIVQLSSDPKWHYRLPFFADSNNKTFAINEDKQETIDQELLYTSQAGIDYWTFDYYRFWWQDNNPSWHYNYELNYYLKSQYKSKMNFSLMIMCCGAVEHYPNDWKTKFVPKLVEYIKEPTYQKVLNGRPLIYMFGASNLRGWFNCQLYDSRYGTCSDTSFASSSAAINFLRDKVKETGLPDPYLVALVWDPSNKNYTSPTGYGFDAISSYSGQDAGLTTLTQKSFDQLKADNLAYREKAKAAGNKIIPPVNTGWDRRPDPDYHAVWYDAGTPEQVASNVKAAIDWNTANPTLAETNNILIYAWNEFSEGGWLGPTIDDNGARINAIADVIGGTHINLPPTPMPTSAPSLTPVPNNNPLMGVMKSKGCLWDSLLFGPPNNQQLAKDIPMLTRTQCRYLIRSIETWNAPPDFTVIQNSLNQIRAATTKDFIYSMFIAESIATNATYFYPDENRNFDFAAMCNPIFPLNKWGPNTCVPSFSSPEYQKYLRYITHKAMDMGIQDFHFGQIANLDSSWATNPMAPEIFSEMRNYAASKNLTIAIGGQTNGIATDYLKNFDYIEGGLAQNPDGSLETGPCASRYSRTNYCWGLVWNDKYRNIANNVIVYLDWGNNRDDDVHRFASMSAQKRSDFIKEKYDFFKSINVGFAPIVNTILSGGGAFGDQCYGRNIYYYSANKDFTHPNACRDEDAINSVLGGFSPSSTILKLDDVRLHGIGSGGDNSNPTALGNTNPLTKTRDVTIEILNSSGAKTYEANGTITYDSTTQTFKGQVSLPDTFTTGDYFIKFKAPGYLNVKLPNLFTITKGVSFQVPQIVATAGDVNRDNSLTIEDYDILSDCYSVLLPARNCSDPAKKKAADILDDGNVDQKDFNIFIREISTVRGD